MLYYMFFLWYVFTEYLSELQVRNFEKVGLTRQQAEALTEHLTEVLCSHKEKLSEAYVTKAQLEKVGITGPSISPPSSCRWVLHIAVWIMNRFFCA